MKDKYRHTTLYFPLFSSGPGNIRRAIILLRRTPVTEDWYTCWLHCRRLGQIFMKTRQPCNLILTPCIRLSHPLANQFFWNNHISFWIIIVCLTVAVRWYSSWGTNIALHFPIFELAWTVKNENFLKNVYIFTYY